MVRNSAMSLVDRSRTSTWFRVSVQVICVLVLAGILIAGLWPFHAPKNDVSWLAQEHGIVLGDYGSLVSAGPVTKDGFIDSGSATLEVILQPARIRESGTI